MSSDRRVRRTSIDAHHRIKDQLPPCRKGIYSILIEHAPLTVNEIFRILQGYTTIVQANCHARLNEMEREGLTVRIGVKKCCITGNTVDLWDLNDDVDIQLSLFDLLLPLELGVAQ